MSEKSGFDSFEKKGHRRRMHERFKRGKYRSLVDSDLLEILLFYSIARKDTKPIARALMKQFKSLAAIIFADEAELRNVPGVGDKTIEFIGMLSDLFSRMCVPLDEGKTHILSDWMSVLKYCQFTMGFKNREAFRVLFLNKKNKLIADELFETGTVDRVTIYPREVARHAVTYGAVAILLVHNHPSGQVSPSKEDIVMTRKIESSLSAINVSLHDHIIVTQDKHFSFRAANLLG